jgi:hypothetical protein
LVKIWKQDARCEEFYTSAQMINMKEVAPLKVMRGISLKGIFPKVSLVLQYEFPPADFFDSGSLYFIVSEPLKELLEKHANAQIEYYELELRQRGKIYTDKRFYFANIMSQVDCFDRQNGQYTPQGELINKITKLAIDETKIGASNLFRVEKAMYMIVAVTEFLAAKILAEGFTGVRFLEPSEWKY